MKDFIKHTEALKISIDKALDRLLPKASEEPKFLHKAMRYSVFSGGKRIRPIVLIESCAACGGKKPQAVRAACAVELVHTYSLIHDDLPSMDDDDYRRGRPSCHKVFGEAEAILAGDALLTLAFNILAVSYAPQVASLLVKELSQAIGTKGMAGGQALEIESGRRNKNRNTLGRINRLKTSKLFEASAKMGGICALAGPKKAGRLARYGIYIGDAFQITDDILDRDGIYTAKDAEVFTKKAKSSLKIFGKNALRLKEIAEYICRRVN